MNNLLLLMGGRGIMEISIILRNGTPIKGMIFTNREYALEKAKEMNNIADENHLMFVYYSVYTDTVKVE